MKSFITVDRKSPDFIKYLDGTFSTSQRAVAIESLNLNSSSESVTFEIINANEISKPTAKEFILSLLKVYKFIYFMFPIFYISLIYYLNSSSFDAVTMLLATIATAFLFVGVNLRSDYWDHIKGIDRIIKTHQSKPIVQGWIRAATVKNLSLYCMFMSLALSIPIIIAFPKVLGIILFSIGIIYFGLLRSKLTYRDFPLGDFFWGILVGPVLSTGFELAISGQVSFSVFCFGLVWGTLIFFKIQISNFEYILAGSLAGVKNMVNHFGFENGKKFILASWVLFIFSFVAYQMSLSHWLIWISTLGILIYMTLKNYKSLMSLKSPSGSDLPIVVSNFQQLYALAVTLWMVQTLFMFFVKAMEILFK